MSVKYSVQLDMLYDCAYGSRKQNIKIIFTGNKQHLFAVFQISFYMRIWRLKNFCIIWAFLAAETGDILYFCCQAIKSFCQQIP